MSREVREFSVTIPKGTSKTSPNRQKLALPPRVVSRITVRVPPGPRGVMGFAVGNGGVPVIPINATGWIVTDNETIDYPLTEYVTSGTWDVIGYNTGTYTHTIYLSFYCTLPGTKATGAVTVQTAVGIGAASFGGTTGRAPTLPASRYRTLPTIPVSTLPTPPPVPAVSVPTLPTPPPVPTVPVPRVPTLPVTTPELTVPVTTTPTGPPPPPLGQWVVAPDSSVQHWGRYTYTPITTYAQSVALAATPTLVFLWTRTQNSPSLPQTQASLKAWEHTGNHAFTQYTAYRRS